MIDDQDQPTTRNEAGDIEQNDDLSKIIYGAIDGDTDAPEVEEAPEPKARARDENGRFKAADDAPEAEEDEPEATASAEEPATEPEASDEATEEESERPAWDDGHFRGWEPEHREKFASLTPEQQTAVMEFKGLSDAALTRAQTEFAEFRKVAEPLTRVANEARDVFAAANMTPDQALAGYANIERTLAFGTLDQKYQLLGQIAQTYGIPLDIQSAVPFDADIDNLRQVHDRDSRLRQEQARIAQLESQLNEVRQQQYQSQIASFAAATNADGSPKHPHFEVVKGAMGQLLASGAAQSMEDAYAMAAKPIEDRIAAELARVSATTTAKQREAVEKAKRAAPLKKSPQPALNGHRAAAPSLDDAINQALDSAGF